MTHGLGFAKPGPRAAKPITPLYVENNYRIEVKITFTLIAYLVLLCEFFCEFSIFHFCRPYLQELFLWSLCVVTLVKKKNKQTKRKQRNYFLSRKVELTLYFYTAPPRPFPHVSVLVFFPGLAYRPHVSRKNGHRKRIFSKTFSSVETLE